MLRALSTAACPLPGDGRTLYRRWRERAGDRVSALAVDARLGPELQEELLEVCRTEGLACPELAHSRLGPSGRRAASPISADREERRTAREQIAASVRLASEHGAGRVLLLGATLPLALSRAELGRRFARGRPLGLEELTEERAALAGPALDHLSLVLDAVLPLAAERSVCLLLPVPSPWPDQVPGPGELATLLELFRGAPLASCYGTDWAHVAASLSGGEPLPATRAPGVVAVRVADACGLRPRLAPGTGEARLESLLAGAAKLDQVLAPGPEVWPEEIGRAIDRLERLPGDDATGRG